MEGSSRQFQRNGKWHDAAAARVRLQRKSLGRRAFYRTGGKPQQRVRHRLPVHCPGQPGQGQGSGSTPTCAAARRFTVAIDDGRLVASRPTGGSR
ncbi:DUF5329 domain-containing protein [Stenotrophomonas sp. Marseille-Q4652]|uniref:DUF5329 domain-containing protein n=1 Tax=Stenotrophomonas sp. Marseille-Q4652 TaxID=2866595 RepID=UPI0021F17033|nr:DUF5329 domain-containing protein [Stenotrophomonas sp. Marseille-Q4652]